MEPTRTYTLFAIFLGGGLCACSADDSGHAAEVQESHLTADAGASDDGALVGQTLELKGTCKETVTVNHFASRPVSSSASLPVTIVADQGGKLRGTVHVGSPDAAGGLPLGLWRALCHTARQDRQDLDSPCGWGDFELTTGQVALGYGISSFRLNNEGKPEFYFTARFDEGRTHWDYACDVK